MDLLNYASSFLGEDHTVILLLITMEELPCSNANVVFQVVRHYLLRFL